MLYSSEENKNPEKVKQQYYGNTPATEADSSLNGSENEVDDKILHEDEDDFEAEDKIDDAELDRDNESNSDEEERAGKSNLEED